MNLIVTNPIIMILKAILNYFRIRRNYIADAVDKIPPEIADKFLKMIEEEDGNVDIENLLGKVTDNLIVSGVKEYSGMSIGNGKIAIGIPGTDKSIVLEANDIETFKQSLVK